MVSLTSRASLDPVLVSSLDRLIARFLEHHDAGDVELIRRAGAAAIRAHEGQLRRTGEPYVTHPIAVAAITADLGLDETTIAAALLHDTIEDTATTAEEILEAFGETIAGVVLEVTDDKKLSKVERKQLQVAHAPHLSPGAKLVKLADKICNLRDIRRAPPPDWSLERRREYFEWARCVVEGLRGAHGRLEAIFDAEYAERP